MEKTKEKNRDQSKVSKPQILLGKEIKLRKFSLFVFLTALTDEHFDSLIKNCGSNLTWWGKNYMLSCFFCSIIFGRSL